MQLNIQQNSNIIKTACLFVLFWSLIGCGGGENSVDGSIPAETDSQQTAVGTDGGQTSDTGGGQTSDTGGGQTSDTGGGQNNSGNTNTNIKNADEIDYIVSAVPVGDPVTNLSITNMTGSKQDDVAITFGQVFAPGALPSGTPIMVRDSISGSVLPTQIDIKASHKDGSVRHSVITARLPSLAGNGKRNIELVVVDSASTDNAPSLNELLNTNFDATVSLNVAGTNYTVSAKQLLGGAGVKTWLAGGQVSEWIVSAPLKKQSDGTLHPHLTARFNVRAYKTFDPVRVDVIVENNWAYEANPGNITYDATIKVCGNTVYKKNGLQHYHHSRWRKTGWCGTQPQINIAHNADYIMSTGAIPNYDQSLTIPESELVKMASNWTGSKIEPMGIGTTEKYMPMTGARNDIGPLPRWAVRYLLSQDQRARTVMLGNADLAGSWPIHYRDQNTDLPISLLDYPYMTIQGGNGTTYNPSTGKREVFPPCPDKSGEACYTPYTADTAHQPSLSYLPYLITGDYYYLEELQFWAAFNAFRPSPRNHKGKGLFQDEQVRGQAWSLRTLAHAAYITPDTHPLKSYFSGMVKNNIDYYDAQYTHNASAPALGFVINGGGLKKKDGKGQISPWNDDALTMVVDWLVGLGFDYAAPFRDWKVQFVLGRFTHPDFCRYGAAVYRYTVQETYDKGGPVIDTWAGMLRSTFPTSVGNCPAGYHKEARPKCAECYLSITRGALSAAKAAGYTEALSVFNEVKAAQDVSNVDFNVTPQWAIVPR